MERQAVAQPGRQPPPPGKTKQLAEEKRPCWLLIWTRAFTDSAASKQHAQPERPKCLWQKRLASPSTNKHPPQKYRTTAQSTLLAEKAPQRDITKVRKDSEARHDPGPLVLSLTHARYGSLPPEISAVINCTCAQQLTQLRLDRPPTAISPHPLLGLVSAAPQGPPIGRKTETTDCRAKHPLAYWSSSAAHAP
jgi:hypothetical protein